MIDGISLIEIGNVEEGGKVKLSGDTEPRREGKLFSLLLLMGEVDREFEGEELMGEEGEKAFSTKHELVTIASTIFLREILDAPPPKPKQGSISSSKETRMKGIVLNFFNGT